MRVHQSNEEVVSFNTEEIDSVDFCVVPPTLTTVTDIYGYIIIVVVIGSQVWMAENLCPTGWYVPTQTDFSNLLTFLGGYDFAGAKLKEAGTTLWVYAYPYDCFGEPNNGATNKTGFTALPGGQRLFSSFGFILTNGSWWSTTESSNQSVAFYIEMQNDQVGAVIIEFYKEFGHSIHCMRIWPE